MAPVSLARNPPNSPSSPALSIGSPSLGPQGSGYILPPVLPMLSGTEGAALSITTGARINASNLANEYMRKLFTLRVKPRVTVLEIMSLAASVRANCEKMDNDVSSPYDPPPRPPPTPPRAPTPRLGLVSLHAHYPLRWEYRRGEFPSRTGGAISIGPCGFHVRGAVRESTSWGKEGPSSTRCFGAGRNRRARARVCVRTHTHVCAYHNLCTGARAPDLLVY